VACACPSVSRSLSLSLSLSEREKTEGNGKGARAGIVIERGRIKAEREELTGRERQNAIASCGNCPSSRPGCAREQARRSKDTQRDRTAKHSFEETRRETGKPGGARSYLKFGWLSLSTVRRACLSLFSSGENRRRSTVVESGGDESRHGETRG